MLYNKISIDVLSLATSHYSIILSVYLLTLLHHIVLDQFDNLLNEHTDLEHFMLWAEDMVNATVVKVSTDTSLY